LDQDTSATVTETPSSRANAISAAAVADEAIMIALSTAVAFAVSAAASDADAGEMPRLAISGSDTSVDTSAVSGSDSFTVNSDAALKLSPISDRMAGTLSENATVEVINGKLQIADIASETGAFKLDAGAALQLDGSDAVNGLVITDGTNSDAINLPEDHTTKTAWHASDDGRGGKTAHNAPASETGEDTSVHSTSADNHFSVSSRLTETPSGNGDHSAPAFKPSVEHDATIDPGINLASLPKDQLPQHPADNLIRIPAQPDHGADPPHPHVDENQSARADDGNALHDAGPSDLPTLTALPSDSRGTHGPATPAHAPDEDTPADSGHHPIADPKINIASNAEHNGDNSSAAIGGADPAHRQDDKSESAVSKFADDGKGAPPADHGHHANADPETNSTSNAEHSADNSRHTPAQDGDNSSAVTGGAHPAHGQVDRGEPASPKFADNGSPQSAHTTGEDTSVSSTPADHGHHGNADPKNKDIATDLPPRHPADNSLHAQHDDNGSPAVTGRAHPPHDQVDSSEPASPKLADDGSPPSAHTPGEDTSVPSAPADHGHRADADPGIKLASVPPNHPSEQHADNSLHTPKQHDDNGSPAVIGGAHPAHRQVDVSESASPNFADNGSPKSAHATGEDTSVPSALASNGHHGNADPKNNDIATDLPLQHPADDSLHTPAQDDDNGSPASIGGAHPAHRQVDSSGPTSSIFADNGSPHSAHATGEAPSVPSTPADNGHHPITDPEINLASIAPNQPPEHPADNLPPMPAQPEDGPHLADPPVDVNEVLSFKFADNGSDHGTGPDGAHPAHPQVDRNQSDSFKFADGGDHPGTIPNDPPTALTAQSSDLRGAHGPAAPTLANTFNVPDAGMSPTLDQFIFAGKAGHDPVADHKPDVIEIDHPLPRDVQQLLDMAHETNPGSTPDPHHAIAPANVQAPYHHDTFHLA
jgi:hypothetical protein